MRNYSHEFTHTNKLFSVSFKLFEEDTPSACIHIDELYVDSGDIMEIISMSEARITEKKLKEIIYSKYQEEIDELVELFNAEIESIKRSSNPNKNLKYYLQ